MTIEDRGSVHEIMTFSINVIHKKPGETWDWIANTATVYRERKIQYGASSLRKALYKVV